MGNHPYLEDRVETLEKLVKRLIDRCSDLNFRLSELEAQHAEHVEDGGPHAAS